MHRPQSPPAAGKALAHYDTYCLKGSLRQALSRLDVVSSALCQTMYQFCAMCQTCPICSTKKKQTVLSLYRGCKPMLEESSWSKDATWNFVHDNLRAVMFNRAEDRQTQRQSTETACVISKHDTKHCAAQCSPTPQQGIEASLQPVRPVNAAK